MSGCDEEGRRLIAVRGHITASTSEKNGIPVKPTGAPFKEVVKVLDATNADVHAGRAWATLHIEGIGHRAVGSVPPQEVIVPHPTTWIQLYSFLSPSPVFNYPGWLACVYGGEAHGGREALEFPIDAIECTTKSNLKANEYRNCGDVNTAWATTPGHVLGLKFGNENTTFWLNKINFAVFCNGLRSGSSYSQVLNITEMSIEYVLREEKNDGEIGIKAIDNDGTVLMKWTNHKELSNLLVKTLPRDLYYPVIDIDRMAMEVKYPQRCLIRGGFRFATPPSMMVPIPPNAAHETPSSATTKIPPTVWPMHDSVARRVITKPRACKRRHKWLMNGSVARRVTTQPRACKHRYIPSIA